MCCAIVIKKSPDSPYHPSATNYRCTAAVITTLFLILSLTPPSLRADSLGREKGARNVQNVPDVTGGMRYLLQDEDLVMPLISLGQDNQLTTGLRTLDTANSGFSGPAQTVPVSQVNTQEKYNTSGVPAAEASGRMFETVSDTLAVLNEGNGPDWQLTLIDPLTKFSNQTELTTRFRPYGTVFTQVALGNFLGNNLDDPLVFYVSLDRQQVEWGMRAIVAADPKNEGTPTVGPEFYGNTEPVPVTGSIVTGDFNGDGRDEIALLLTDYQTIAFYTVDSKTLALSQLTTCMLPNRFVAGQVTLAAGKFRNTVNAELVVFGQLANMPHGYSVLSIAITPNQDGTFTCSNRRTYKFPNKAFSNGAFAQAASILNWPQTTTQQIVLGTRVDHNFYQSYIDIGSFAQDFTFNWQSETHLTNRPTVSLRAMKVGNFDNRCTTNDDCRPLGQHNPALQIETFTLESPFLSFLSVVRLWGIYPPHPIVQVTDWLKPLSHLQTGTAGTVLDVVPGDIQGRSLRLGAPEVIRIPLQIQPDVVLGLPPMHIDWINPVVNTLDPAKHPGCHNPPDPCLLNLTVLPSLPAPGVGFATAFNFTSSSNSEGKRTSTTSWGVSVKETQEAKVGYSGGFIGGSIDIKNSAKYAHDHNVAQTYDTFQGQTDSLSATTGFADHVFFTEKAMNVYYYPVLANKSCPSNDPNCSGDQKYPTYVEFSVPDQITHADVDGTTLEWYQPVHEPGNALSYPWNLTQLRSQFMNVANPLTADPPPCRGTDTSTTSYTTSWTGTRQQSNSSGSSNSFSDDLSISTSGRFGRVLGPNGMFSFSVDVGTSTSLSTLNIDTSTQSASTGVSVSKPEFDSDIAQCCLYDFAGYIFGQKNVNNPAYQSLSLQDPQGNPVDIASTGPMFIGFLSDVVPDRGNGLNCGSAQNWWEQAYDLPDVALNHPARWQWSKSTEMAFFNPADQSGNVSPLDQSFYQMKGFFITPKGEQTTSLNLSTATAGDDLSLTARVYNYSLVDTNGSSLMHPAASIQVRFYGQFYCSSGSQTENSCVNGRQICEPGTLCGNGFLIGQTQLGSILGFKSPTNATKKKPQPNWTTASVDFNTAAFPNHLANSYVVFWVVVWMEDANGHLVPEIPGHGLTMDPRNLQLEQITDVPIEAYSNNVGMYGVNAPFFIFPATQLLGSNGNRGVLQNLSLSGSQRILLENRSKVTTELRAANGPVENVTIAYYDGDPTRNGQLFDLQHISYMDPDVAYRHRSFFTPESCGIHQLYASAWLPNSPEITAGFRTAVTIQPVDQTQALITSTQGAEIADAVLLQQLLKLLNTASQDFQQNEAAAATAAIRAYISTLNSALGKVISRDKGDRLIGQADVILQCVPGPSFRASANVGQTS